MDEKPSALTPINNPKHRNIPEERRCRGHKKNGARCQRPAILGGTVCRHHGGAAAHVKKAAQARMDNFADRAARILIGIAEDPAMEPAIKLKAVKDLLDRCGLSARTAVDVSLELKPYERLFDRLERGGGVDAYAPPAPTVVDGEVVAAWGEFDDGSEP